MCGDIERKELDAQYHVFSFLLDRLLEQLSRNSGFPENKVKSCRKADGSEIG